MYAVTPVGSFLIDKVDKNHERGLISRKEWAREIIMILGDHKAVHMGNLACSINGCNYAPTWRALYLSSDTRMPSWGRLCGGCANWHGSGARNLEPIIKNGVYRPEVDEALDISMRGSHGRWHVLINDEYHDSMLGYGYPWAMTELRRYARQTWVSCGSIKYVDPRTGYSTTIEQYFE